MSSTTGSGSSRPFAPRGPRGPKGRFIAGTVIGLAIGAVAMVVAAVPHAFKSGETLTAANLNDNFASLSTTVAGLEQRIAALEGATRKSGLMRYHLTTTDNMNIPLPAGLFTKVKFQPSGLDVDLGSEFDPASDTFTTAADGLYTVACSVSFSSFPSVAGTYVAVRANQTNLVEDFVNPSSGTSNANAIVKLKTGDVVDCGVYVYTSTEGVSLSAAYSQLTWFSVVKL